MCQRGTTHLATLKSKKLMAFLKTLQRYVVTGMTEKSSLGTRQTDGKILVWVWRNIKKISQIINAYLYFPYFLLISLCTYLSNLSL
jgi:hypothetical protein